jgi:hypothetical protein
MSLDRYSDDWKASQQPQKPTRTEDPLRVRDEPFTFGCGCVACTSDNGSYTVLWCPQHSRAHGDTRDLLAR